MEINQSDALKRLPEQFFSKWNGRIKQLEASGYDVINLGQGSPDLPTDERITDALRHAALDPVKPPISSISWICVLQKRHRPFLPPEIQHRIKR